MLAAGPATRETEVDDPDALGRPFEEDVVGFDITMEQAAGMRGGEALGNLPADSEHLADGRWPVGGPLLGECPSLEQLHHDEGEAVMFTDGMDREHVGMFDGGG